MLDLVPVHQAVSLLVCQSMILSIDDSAEYIARRLSVHKPVSVIRPIYMCCFHWPRVALNVLMHDGMGTVAPVAVAKNLVRSSGLPAVLASAVPCVCSLAVGAIGATWCERHGIMV